MSNNNFFFRRRLMIVLQTQRSPEETRYLLASPRNAACLMAAIAQIEAGKTVEHELIEP